MYDCDGVRVVETTVSLCSQESYELLPGWPEGEPVPRYLPPPDATKGIFTQLLDNIQRKLGLKPASSSPSITDQRVIEIANVVSGIYIITSSIKLYFPH